MRAIALMIAGGLLFKLGVTLTVDDPKLFSPTRYYHTDKALLWLYVSDTLPR